MSREKEKGIEKGKGSRGGCSRRGGDGEHRKCSRVHTESTLRFLRQGERALCKMLSAEALCPASRARIAAARLCP